MRRQEEVDEEHSQGKVGSSCLVLWILRRPLTHASQQRNAGSQREPYQDAVDASEEVSLNNRNRCLTLHDTIFFSCSKGTASHIKGKVQFVELKKRTKENNKSKGTGEMVQQLRVYIALAEDLSSVPSIHVGYHTHM